MRRSCYNWRMGYAELFSDMDAPPKVEIPALAGLTAEQRSAIDLPFDASAVIRAGAGSGKTRLLVARAVQLITAGVSPKRVALISFTRKSAVQLSERIATWLGGTQRVPTCATLHSLALRLCTKQGPVYLYSDEGLGDVIAEVRGVLGPAGKDLSDKDIATTVGRYRELRNFSSTFGLAALHWMEILQEKGFEDFTSLIERALPGPDEQFDYLLVDEAQDLSPVQIQFIQRLLSPRGAIWYVGDDDQSIFLFRGAGDATMQRLSASMQHRRLLSLNWRCDTDIVQSANELMAHADGRERVNWRSASHSAGDVSHRVYQTQSDEVLAAAAFSREAPDRMVLARTQRQLEELRERGVPCCTVHESKGLEWNGVWVMGCVQGSFPHALSSIGEERRLFYVAMTRARTDLVLGSYKQATSRGKELVPSQFIREAGLAL